jgi:hypothetical protein
MNVRAPAGLSSQLVAHEDLAGVTAGAKIAAPGLCPGNKPPPIEVLKAFAFQVPPTTKITSAQTDNKARMPNRTGNEPADRRIVESCCVTREIVNPEAFQHPRSWSAGSGRRLDHPALLASRAAWMQNAGVGYP